MGKHYSSRAFEKNHQLEIIRTYAWQPHYCYSQRYQGTCGLGGIGVGGNARGHLLVAVTHQPEGGLLAIFDGEVVDLQRHSSGVEVWKVRSGQFQWSAD